MNSLNTLDVVEKYFDREMSEDFLKSIDSIPLDHFFELKHLIREEHKRWQEAQSKIKPSIEIGSEPDHILIGSQNESLIFNSILYFRKISMLDPLDPIIDPPGTEYLRIDNYLSHGTRYIDVRKYWKKGLRWLTKIRPLLIAENGVSLVSANPTDLEDRAQVRELQQNIAEENLEMSVNIIPEDVYDEYMPTACRVAYAKKNKLTIHLDETDKILVSKILPISGSKYNKNNQIIQLMLSQENLPTPVDPTFDSILNLRRNDDLFAEFRAKLSKVLIGTYGSFSIEKFDRIQDGSKLQDNDLAAEYLNSLLAELSSDVRALNSKLKFSMGEKFFIPGGVGIAMGLIMHLAGFGPAAAIGTSVATPAATALLEAYRRRHMTTGPSSNLLLQNYVSLIDAAQKAKAA